MLRQGVKEYEAKLRMASEALEAERQLEKRQHFALAEADRQRIAELETQIEDLIHRLYVRLILQDLLPPKDENALLSCTRLNVKSH